MRIVIHGIPITQGSKTCICDKKSGRGLLLEGRRGPARKAFEAWRKLVADEARLAVMGDDGSWPTKVAVAVDLEFYLHRPKTPSDPRWPSARGQGDVDKYARAVLDSLTGPVLVDDSQVVDLRVRKVYGDKPGLIVRVAPVT